MINTLLRSRTALCLCAWYALNTFHCVAQTQADPVPEGTAPSQLVFAQPMAGGDGLLGSYFDNRHLTGAPVTSRVEGPVDFDWGLGAPAGITNADEFGARWSGELQAQHT